MLSNLLKWMCSGCTGYDKIGICVSMKISLENMAVVEYWLLTVVFLLLLSCKDEQSVCMLTELCPFFVCGQTSKTNDFYYKFIFTSCPLLWDSESFATLYIYSFRKNVFKFAKMSCPRLNTISNNSVIIEL